MSTSYSYDLRTKAIEAVERGERKSDVCRMLKLSRNTLDLWLKRKAQTGDYQGVHPSYAVSKNAYPERVT